MAEVGRKTEKKTQAGRDVYKTPEGEMVSEKSTTFKYKGKWINIPSIHNGYSYDDDTLILMLEAGLIEPTSTHNNKKEAEQAARKRSDNLKFNKGGTPMMEQQMEPFRRGGLNDEGGEIDEVSGNKVPVGGTKKGVRDDVPAMVSEGEFVFPEDVVRYIGLDKLMQMRQKAKMGLKKMEAMGQMGNGDEAIIPDDLPFNMADLIIVSSDTGEELEMQEGGFVRRPTTVTRTTQQPTYTQPPVNASPYERPVFRSVRALTPTIPRPAPSVINFDKLMGDARINFKEYRNASGQSVLIPFLGDSPIFPIPQGYSLYQPSAEETTSEGQEVVETINEVLANAPRDSSESRSSSAMVRNEFTEAGSWEGVPLDMYIKEATKFVDGSSSLATGIIGAFAGLPMGLFTRVAVSDQKKRILATIDKRIQEAKGTPVEGQVAQLRKIKAILEGKEAPAGAFDKVKNIVNSILAPEGVKQQAVQVAAKSPVKMETPESDAALAEQVKRLSGPAAAEAEFGAPLGDPLGGTPPPVNELVSTSILPQQYESSAAQMQAMQYDPLAPLANLDDRDTMREIGATGIMPTGEKAFDVISDLSKDPAYASTILPTGTGGMLRDGSAQPKDPLARLTEEETQRRTARIQAEDPIAKRAELASVYQTPSVVAGQPVVTPPTPVSYELPDELTIPAFTQSTSTVAPTTETPTVSQIDYTDIQTSGPPSVPDAMRTPLGTAAAASAREQEVTLPTAVTPTPTPTVQDQMATALPAQTISGPKADEVSQMPDPYAYMFETPKETVVSPVAPSYATMDMGEAGRTEKVTPTTTAKVEDPYGIGDAGEFGGTPITTTKDTPKEDKPATTAQPSLAPDVSLRPQARPTTTTASKDDKPAATTTTSKDTNVASSGRTETQIQADINAALKASGDVWTSELNDLVAERDSARANEGSSGGGGGDDGGSSGGGCVIATHGISTGGFSLMEKAKAEIWCERTYHGKWYGEAFRRGYRYAGNKAIQKGKAEKYYQEFKDFVACGRGIKKDWKSKINYYKRTIQFFLTGLIIKEDV